MQTQHDNPIEGKKRFQFIACSVMQREAYFCAARSKNTIDIHLLEQGLHDEPDQLRAAIQQALERTTDVSGRQYDACLLGYGLCSNGIVGVESKIPVIVPRGHDCITLLLGSKEKYKEYFDSHRGIYWYTTGWIDAGKMPGKIRYENMLDEYVEKYGRDNAKYLMEVEQKWMKEYSCATYIDWGFPDSDAEKDYTRRCAEFLGWNYDEIKGDASLMQKLFDGQWSENEFLIVRPGRSIVENLTQDGIIDTS